MLSLNTSQPMVYEVFSWCFNQKQWCYTSKNLFDRCTSNHYHKPCKEGGCQTQLYHFHTLFFGISIIPIYFFIISFNCKLLHEHIIILSLYLFPVCLINSTGLPVSLYKVLLTGVSDSLYCYRYHSMNSMAQSATSLLSSHHPSKSIYSKKQQTNC